MTLKGSAQSWTSPAFDDAAAKALMVKKTPQPGPLNNGIAKSKIILMATCASSGRPTTQTIRLSSGEARKYPELVKAGILCNWGAALRYVIAELANGNIKQERYIELVTFICKPDRPGITAELLREGPPLIQPMEKLPPYEGAPVPKQPANDKSIKRWLQWGAVGPVTNITPDLLMQRNINLGSLVKASAAVAKKRGSSPAASPSQLPPDAAPPPVKLTAAAVQDALTDRYYIYDATLPKPLETAYTADKWVDAIMSAFEGVAPLDNLRFTAAGEWALVSEMSGPMNRLAMNAFLGDRPSSSLCGRVVAFRRRPVEIAMAMLRKPAQGAKRGKKKEAGPAKTFPAPAGLAGTVVGTPAKKGVKRAASNPPKQDAAPKAKRSRSKQPDQSAGGGAGAESAAGKRPKAAERKPRAPGGKGGARAAASAKVAPEAVPAPANGRKSAKGPAKPKSDKPKRPAKEASKVVPVQTTEEVIEAAQMPRLTPEDISPVPRSNSDCADPLEELLNAAARPYAMA